MNHEIGQSTDSVNRLSRKFPTDGRTDGRTDEEHPTLRNNLTFLNAHEGKGISTRHWFSSPGGGEAA